MPPQVREFGSLRFHILLPGDIVGSVIFGRPTWPGLTVNEDNVFFRGGEPVLHAERKKIPAGVRVTVRSFTDVWLQELALSAVVAGPGMWRGFGPRNRWVATTTGKEGWLPLEKSKGGVSQAFFSTIHFSRAKSSPRFCVGVAYREGKDTVRFSSDGGFETFQIGGKPGNVPWHGCAAFDKWPLKGVYVPRWEPLRRWELGGHPPDQGWAHFLGGPGGAGCVVNEKGLTARPGSNPTAADGFDCLHRPDTWRVLRRGETASQTLTVRKSSV